MSPDGKQKTQITSGAAESKHPKWFGISRRIPLKGS